MDMTDKAESKEKSKHGFPTMPVNYKSVEWAGLFAICGAFIALQYHNIDMNRLLSGLLLIFFGYVATLCDIREKIVPNKLVIAMIFAWVITVVPMLFIKPDEAAYRILNSLIGFSIAGVIMLCVYFISRQGLGGGDVKWMSAAGLYLGFRNVLQPLLMGSILSAIFCTVLLLRKKITTKDSVPLIPFIYVGVLLTIMFERG